MHFRVSRYGWLPDLPDHRDQPYAAPVEMIARAAGKNGTLPPAMPAGL